MSLWYFVALSETFKSDRLDIFITCSIIKVKQILLKILKWRVICRFDL